MTSRYRLDIPETLTDEEARIVIDVLEEMVDCLCHRLHQLDRQLEPADPDWDDPAWMEPTDGD
jgi:hypothetical protein